MRSYAPAHTPCEIDYRIDAHQLWRNGQLVRETPEAIDVLAAFELDLYQTALSRCRGAGWALHAAAVATVHGVAVMVGPSGAGKSTMTLALLAAGSTYLSDECVLLTRDSAVFGMTRPISFADAPPVVALPEDFVAETYPVRQSDNRMSHPILIHPPRCCPQPASLDLVVLLRHAPAETPQTRRLTAGEALCALWPHALMGHDDGLAVATDLVARYPVFTVTTRTVDDARATILNLTKRVSQ